MRAILVSLMSGLILTGCSQSSQSKMEAPAIGFDRVSADTVAHGERLATVLGCAGCHNKDLTGRDWSDELGVLWTANLTQAAKAYSDDELVKMITGGANPKRELWGMPSHLFTQLSDNDMKAVLAFVRSRPVRGEVHPEVTFTELGRKELEKGTFVSSKADVEKSGNEWPPDAGQNHALARYIVRSTCAECHQLNLRGGQPNPEAEVRADLRIAAAYDFDQFKTLLRTGIAAGGRELGLMKEVAEGRYSHLTDSEIRAIHEYLKRVAEIDP